jgi:hypothetical protein
MKDLKNHHVQLLTELDVLIEDRNELHEKINKATQQSHSASGLLSKIDEWQKITLAKVKEAADRARQQVSIIMNTKRMEIATKFETFSKELVHMKETEEFVHDDLTRLQQMIQDLNQDLKQLAHPPSVELRTEQSNQVDWNCLIYVEQKAPRSESQEQPKRKTGLIILITRHFLNWINENLISLSAETFTAWNSNHSKCNRATRIIYLLFPFSNGNYRTEENMTHGKSEEKKNRRSVLCNEISSKLMNQFSRSFYIVIESDDTTYKHCQSYSFMKEETSKG